MGGSQADIERNLASWLLSGSAGTASLQAVDASRDTSRVAGAAAGGATLVAVLKALLTGGALGAYGAQVEAERLADEKRQRKQVALPQTPGIKVAGGDDASADTWHSISAKPEMLGKSGDTASAVTARVDEGVTRYEQSHLRTDT
jgi:hypothetical protein